MKLSLSHSAIILMVPLLLCFCSKNKDMNVEPGISQELALARKARIDSIVYELFFDIPSNKQEPINGSVVIRFDLSTTDKELVLDFNADPEKIKTVTVNTEPVDVIWREEHLIIPAEYLDSRNAIKITFEAGDQSLNRSADYLYTLFVPERASTCFPLFDQPDLKARYSLSLSVPSSWKAIANGKVKSINQNENNTTYTFKETQPLSSYLFAFVAGKFEVISRHIGGRDINMYHRETDSAKVTENLAVIFDWHTKALNWMEEYTNIPLPFQKFDFVLIPSFQYNGMEHPGAVLYNASSLLLDRSSTLTDRLNRARLIAHETAHMWFGNLVTMQWFNDVWLKEVFANLMAAKIVNPGFPEINHDLQFLMDHYPKAYKVDRSKGTHPIQQPLGNLKNAGTIYGPIIYEKAPIVMRMLEEGVGEEAFRTGMRKYLTKYSYGNAQWDNLIDILSAGATFDIKLWDLQWVKSPGMPVITYTIDSTKNRDQLEVSLGDEQQSWKQDLVVFLGYKDSTAHMPAPFLTGPNRLSLLNKPHPNYLFLNSNGKGYGYFKMSAKSLAHFMNEIDEQSDPVLRAAVWINLYEAVLRGDLSPVKLLNRGIKSLVQEEEALIAEYITSVMETIYWHFYTEEERVQLAPRLEGVLLNLMLHASSSNLKATYFNALKSMAISDHGVLVLKKFWEEEIAFDDFPLSEKDLTSLAYELAVREVTGYEQILLDQRNNISNPDRRKKFDFITPALSADPAVRDDFFQRLKDPENRENEAWVLEALTYLHHPLRQNEAIKYIEPSLKMLQEIQTTGDIFFPKGWVRNTLNGHSSKAAESQVKKFLSEQQEYPDRFKNIILQAADLLFRSVDYKR